MKYSTFFPTGRLNHRQAPAEETAEVPIKADSRYDYRDTSPLKNIIHKLINRSLISGQLLKHKWSTCTTGKTLY